VEVLLIELVGERPAKSVEIRHIKVELLAKRCELAVVSDRVELFVEVRESFRWLFGNSFVIVETEVMFAFAVNDVADDDQCDLRDGALAAEGGEVEVDHCTDSAVALSRRQSEAAT
jgi:hypothetical protein